MQGSNEVQSEVIHHQFDRANQSENYLKYRPSYPVELLESTIGTAVAEVKAKSKTGKVNAIDMCCGSGQLTRKLLPYFDHIFAVDVNESQLAQGVKTFQPEIAEKRVEFRRFDCSKIDELLGLPEVQELEPQFVFIGEAFHWFDYDDFLTRFKKATQNSRIYLVLCSYRTFGLVHVDDKHKKVIHKFVDLINPYFAFNRASLDNEYQEFSFVRYFDHVLFKRYDEPVKNVPIQNLLGYLDTWSAYRNYLEKKTAKGESDPLVDMMRELGLKGGEGKDFGKIETLEGSLSHVSYNNKFFVYVLK